MYVEICVYFLKSPDRSSSEILPVVAALTSRQIASALIQLQLRQGRGFPFRHSPEHDSGLCKI